MFKKVLSLGLVLTICLTVSQPVVAKVSYDKSCIKSYASVINKFNSIQNNIISDNAYYEDYNMEQLDDLKVDPIILDGDYDDTEWLAWTLRDINKDGTPELLITHVEDAEEEMGSIVAIYTYVNNKPKLLVTSEAGYLRLTIDSRIRQGYSGSIYANREAGDINTFYRINKSGRLVEINSSHWIAEKDQNGEYKSIKYYVDGKEVDKDTFDLEEDQIDNNIDYVSQLKCYKITNDTLSAFRQGLVSYTNKLYVECEF